MMHGLVLDRSAPLFGRAREILKIVPLPAGWIGEALRLPTPADAVEAYAVWGGTPRYWELAADHPDLRTAIRSLVLSPLGVLSEEPARLLLDDMRDTTQAASILSLIGQGCHRLSEIGAQLGKPATAMSRPIQRLQDMDLVTREQPFAEDPRASKRALYKISDRFLRFWFRFVDVNRSRLGAGQVAVVEEEIAQRLGHQIGEIWEEMARASVPRLNLTGRVWGPVARWWGAGADRRPLEVHLVALSQDGGSLLVGEVKWAAPREAGRLLAELGAKARLLPFAAGREIVPMLWLREPVAELSDRVVTPQQVLEALR